MLIPLSMGGTAGRHSSSAGQQEGPLRRGGGGEEEQNRVGEEKSSFSQAGGGGSSHFNSRSYVLLQARQPNMGQLQSPPVTAGGDLSSPIAGAWPSPWIRGRMSLFPKETPLAAQTWLFLLVGLFIYFSYLFTPRSSGWYL